MQVESRWPVAVYPIEAAMTLGEAAEIYYGQQLIEYVVLMKEMIYAKELENLQGLS